MNKLLLRLVMLPTALWRSMGADTDQLRAILDTKLTLDDRKPMAMGRQQKQRKVKYGSLLSSLVFLVMGFFYSFPLQVIHDRIFSLSLYFSFLLTIITFMMITDFSSVLFDARDKYILFPRPVSDRTIVLSRMLHVFIYLFRVVVPFSLAGWVTLGIRDGWQSAVLFVLPLILLVFMVLFFVNSIYLLVLRLTSPERFKDVINYFQIFASVLFFGSIYLLPRVFDTDHPHDFNILNYTWIKYFPSYWLASIWSWIGAPVTLTGTAIYSALAVVVPVACMYIQVRFLAPQFSSRIAGIDTVDTGPAPVAGTNKRSKTGPRKLYKKLAYAFNTHDDARAGFMIAWLQTARSRSFRMRVYPSFAFLPIYFFYLLAQGKHPIGETLANLPSKPSHLFLLYFSSFTMVSSLNFVAMSDQYKAAWIYYAAPVAVPGRVMVGAFKAMWVKFFLPFYILLATFVLYIWGVPAIWDVVLAVVNVTMFMAIVARVNIRHLPFSIIEQTKQGAGRVLKSMFTMLLIAVLGVGHYFSVHMLWLKLIFLGLSCILLWLVFTSYAETSWENMIKGEVEG